MNQVTVDTKKLDKLIQKLSKKAYVDIGVLEGNRYPGSKMTIAEVGAVHEFGNPELNLPERSFIRMPLEKKQNKIQKRAEKDITENMGNAEINNLLERIGNAGVAAIQESFETGGFGTWEQITEATIAAKKGKESILIDTGLLRKSISYRVGGAKK